MEKMFRNHKLILIFIITGELFFSNACKEEYEDPTIVTLPVSQITYCSATIGAKLMKDGKGTTDWGVCWSTKPNPQLDVNITGKRSFQWLPTPDGSSTITYSGLLENTTYYLRAYASYSSSITTTSYGSEVTFTTQKLNSIINFNPNLTYGSLTDIDGNIYKTIQIGSQYWMAENLRVTKFQDGTTLQIISNDFGFSDTTGAYCNYGNNATYINTFGRLYTYYAIVNNKKLCPTGWHVPSDAEWTLLETYLGGPGLAGDKLKEVGASHWLPTNSEATNESGFTALPGGNHLIDQFYELGSSGYWLIPISTEIRYRSLHYDYKEIFNNVHYSATSIYDPELIYGFRSSNCYSVRCLKD